MPSRAPSVPSGSGTADRRGRGRAVSSLRALGAGGRTLSRRVPRPAAHAWSLTTRRQSASPAPPAAERSGDDVLVILAQLVIASFAKALRSADCGLGRVSGRCRGIRAGGARAACTPVRHRSRRCARLIAPCGSTTTMGDGSPGATQPTDRGVPRRDRRALGVQPVGQAFPVQRVTGPRIHAVADSSERLGTGRRAHRPGRGRTRPRAVVRAQGRPWAHRPRPDAGGACWCHRRGSPDEARSSFRRCACCDATLAPRR